MAEKLEWLKTNLSPIDCVQKYWKDTFEARYQLLVDNIGILDYCTSFPSLQTSLGIELVNNKITNLI